MTKTLAPMLLVLVSGMLVSQAAFAYSTLDKYMPSHVQSPAEFIKTHPSSPGGGVPLLAPDGVLGASAITASIFGGIAAMFFIRGRTGRYVAQGRG